MFLVSSEAERRHIAELAWTYYRSFDNVFGGPGIVDRGIIRPLPRAQTVDELAANLLLCGRDEMIEAIQKLDITIYLANSNLVNR